MFKKINIVFWGVISIVCAHASHHADIAEIQHIPSHDYDQSDIYMNLHQVFSNIDMARKDVFWDTLRSSEIYGELEKKNLNSFFDYLSNHHNPSPNPYESSQVAYHLTALTILGPEIAQNLIEGAYDWVLNDDKRSFGLYNFLCDPSNIFLRQEIFEKMKSTGFVISEIKNLTEFEYYPDLILLEKLYCSQNPVTIVIGGNRLSKKHGDYNHYSASRSGLDRVVQSAYGSNSYQFSFEDDVITISVDHRDRPQICTNAFSSEVWESIDWNLVSTIWIDGYSSLADQFKSIIPAEYHEKIRIIH